MKLSGSTLVRASNISHSFDGTLYENISLSLGVGESVAILGVSGSGKSTILNSLATFLKPVSGSVGLCGHEDVYSLCEKELLHLRRNVLGIIFQFHYLFRGFTVRENLMLSEIMARTSMREEMLKDFGIDRVIDKHVGELSGGQQQRVSIARVLAKNPKVLIADEPTGSLDSDTAIVVMGYLLRYIRENGACLIIATHDKEIARLCDRALHLRNKTLSEGENVNL